MMIFGQIQTRRIKDKFDELKRFPLEEYVGYDLPTERYIPAVDMALSTAVKMRLWKVLQKFQGRCVVEMPRRSDWMDGHFDRSLIGDMMIKHNDMLAEDTSSSHQARSSESRHEQKREEMFEDIAQGDFLLEDYDFMESDAFDDLLWDENSPAEDAVYPSNLNGEPSDAANCTPGVGLRTISMEFEQISFGGSVEPLAEGEASTIYDSIQDELLDVGDQAHQERASHLLLDDFFPDEDSRSLDLTSDQSSYNEMMMDD